MKGSTWGWWRHITILDCMKRNVSTGLYFWIISVCSLRSADRELWLIESFIIFGSLCLSSLLQVPWLHLPFMHSSGLHSPWLTTVFLYLDMSPCRKNCWQCQKTTPSSPGQQFGEGALSFALVSLWMKKEKRCESQNSRWTQIAALKLFGCPKQT